MPKVKPEDLTEAVQSPADAVYGLFVGGESNATFDSDKLTVINSSSATLDGIRVKAAIIGESHFVRVIKQADDSVVLTELLACADPAKLGFQPDICRTLREISGFNLVRRFDDLKLRLKVSVKIRPKTLSRRLFVPHVRRLQPGVVLRLKERFPEVHEAHLKPRTIVSVVLTQEGVRIKTVHEYVTADGHIEPLTSSTRIFFNLG